MLKRKYQALLILLSSSLFGCSSFEASTNELWKRAGYLDESKPILTAILSRKIERREKVYLGKRILPNGEIFEEGSILILMDQVK